MNDMFMDDLVIRGGQKNQKLDFELADPILIAPLIPKT